jgi:cytochrome b involved in lipid metabolism
LNYTRAEVALHNTDKDLWVIINNKIYNFSGYAKSHPGGDKIFYDCAGKDATEAYEDSEHPTWADH